MQQYTDVLAREANNKQALAGMTSLTMQTKNIAAATGWAAKLSTVDPTDKTVWYSRGVLAWMAAYPEYQRADRWLDFLSLFQGALRSGGLLIFSAHGREAFRRTAKESFDYGVGGAAKIAILFGYQRFGFGYDAWGTSKTFGHSLSRSDWVLQEIVKFPQLRVVHFAETAW